MVIKQDYNIGGTGRPKKLFPSVKVEINGVVIPETFNFNIKETRDNLSNHFSIDFIGDTYITQLNPFTNNIFSISTAYRPSIMATPSYVKQIWGYPDTIEQSISGNKLTTTGNFLDPIKLYLPPKVNKLLVNVIPKRYKSGDIALTSTVRMSEIISDIFSSLGLPYRFSGQDYNIFQYRMEDFPLNIVKDLVEFIGNFIRYDYINNIVNILPKYNGGGYDFVYDDFQDITDLSYSDNISSFYNTVRIFGAVPNDYLVTSEEVEDEIGGYIWTGNQELHLVDTVEGVEPAPADPYIDEIPKDLIEKKFYNVWMGFDIDPKSLKAEGGTWSDKDNKYEGAKILGYGTFYESKEITLENINSEEVAGSMTRESLAPSEGKVGFNWNYTTNDDNVLNPAITISNGSYSTMNLFGKVVDSIDKKELEQVAIKLDLEYEEEDSVWQWWRYVSKKENKSGIKPNTKGISIDEHGRIQAQAQDKTSIDILFYLPKGMPSSILGSEWQDVTYLHDMSVFFSHPDPRYANCIEGIPDPADPILLSIINDPSIYNPPTMPLYAMTKSGDSTDKNNQKGYYEFTNLPISKYKVTASKIGYDDNDLQADIDPSCFDFLKTLPSKNKTKKYKLIDTKYDIKIYAKQAPPISFGDLPEEYTEDSWEKPLEGISLECRYANGISKSGCIVLGDDINDARIMDEETAVKVARSRIREVIASGNTRTFKLPHNPYLRAGMNIAINSQHKGWVRKVFTVHSRSVDYSLSGTTESLFDLVECVEYV